MDVHRITVVPGDYGAARLYPEYMAAFLLAPRWSCAEPELALVSFDQVPPILGPFVIVDVQDLANLQKRHCLWSCVLNNGIFFGAEVEVSWQNTVSID